MKKKEAKYPIPIREWSEDDRPRENLLKYRELYTISYFYPVKFTFVTAKRISLGSCPRRASVGGAFFMAILKKDLSR
jgi:hypothetical protein